MKIKKKKRILTNLTRYLEWFSVIFCLQPIRSTLDLFQAKLVQSEGGSEGACR